MNYRIPVILFALFAPISAGESRAAIALSDLVNPNMQTLIDLGSSGVEVGSDRFFNFTFSGSTGTGAPAATDVRVQPLTGDSTGLRFISTWFASGGSSIADAITYNVQVTDPTAAVQLVSLFSNGTAPLSQTGTFATTSLTARMTGGPVAGRILRTFDDGVTTVPAAVNVDWTSILPQFQLAITDAIVSNSSSGGVATASIVENSFTAVPEPGNSIWVLIAITGTALMIRRRRPAISGNVSSVEHPGL